MAISYKLTWIYAYSSLDKGVWLYLPTQGIGLQIKSKSAIVIAFVNVKVFCLFSKWHGLECNLGIIAQAIQAINYMSNSE